MVAAICRRLAAEIDRDDLPPYVLAKLASTLVSLMATLDGDGAQEEAPERAPTRAELSRLLDLVNRTDA